MKWLIIVIPLLLALGCDQKQGRNEGKKETDIVVGNENIKEDREVSDLVINSMMNSRLQIALAGLAAEKAGDQELEAFCQTLIDNHQQFQNKVATLAMAYEVPIPDGLTVEAQATLDRIRELEGEAFKASLLTVIVETHQEDIERYMELLKREDQVLERGMLEEMLDEIQQHLKQARELQGPSGEA